MTRILNLNYKISALLIAFVILLQIFGCRKYVEVGTPSTRLDAASVFNNDAGAAQFIIGIYTDLASGRQNGSMLSTCWLPEMSADNLALFDANSSMSYIDYYQNSLEPEYANTGSTQSSYWYNGYKLLFNVNTAIEQLTGNTRLTPKIMHRLLGESHFLRAFLYFYLLNFHGEVPLILSTDYRQNASIRKSTEGEVYDHILADLQIAEGLLNVSYVTGDALAISEDRLRPNLIAVYALQARTHLYMKQYAAAEAASTKVITQAEYGLNTVEHTFLKNSSETIWALQPTEIGLNSYMALLFLLPSGSPNIDEFPMYASTSLVNSFEPGDARKSSWLGVVKNDTGDDFYYPAKYKRGYEFESTDISEFSIILRVAEQYLIRAEARNEQNNTDGAIADLNMLRNKRRGPSTIDVPNPLPALTNALTQFQVRSIVLNERRVELFTEFAHRWFDLRRSGTIDTVMTLEHQTKKGSWSSYKMYYPVPQYDRITNPGITQTPGYSN
jgi:starch-binding outer membrane protein, SusD/RagB family